MQLVTTRALDSVLLKRRSQRADKVCMGALVVLEYPNGRRHTTVLDARSLEPGAEFDLYGRRWQALGPLVEWQTRNQARDERWPMPILCTSLGKLG